MEKENLRKPQIKTYIGERQKKVDSFINGNVAADNSAAR